MENVPKNDTLVLNVTIEWFYFHVSLKGWPALAIRTLAMRQLPFGDSCHSNTLAIWTLAIWTLAIRDTCHSDTSCSNLAKLSEENKNHFLN